MTLHHYIAGVEVTGLVEFGTLTDITKAAFGGERGGGTVTVSDPTGALDLEDWQEYIAEDDACSQPRIFTVSIKGQAQSRGSEGPIGPGRVWACGLSDLNERAHRKLIRGNAAKRAAESEADRLAWLLADQSVVGLFADTGYVNPDTSPSGGLDASDERRKYPDDVLDEMTPWRGENWFLFYDPIAAASALWLGLQTAAVLDSTIKISNFDGDRDEASLVFATGAAATSDDGTLDRDWSEVYSGIDVAYQLGDLYLQNPTTLAIIDRDYFYENQDIGKLTTATSFANQFLTAHADPRDTLTIPVRLPASAIGLIDAGYRVQVHLENCSGYDGAGYVWVRVSSMKFSQAIELDHYDVVLTCTNMGPATVPGGGGTSVLPHLTTCSTPTLVQSASASANGGLLTVTLGADPTPGNLLVVWGWSHGDPVSTLSATPGFTAAPQGIGYIPHVGVTSNAWGSICIYYRTVEPGDTAAIGPIAVSDSTRLDVAEFSGSYTVLEDSDSASTSGYHDYNIDAPLGSVTVAAASLVLGFAGWSSNADPATYTINRGTIGGSGMIGGGFSPQAAWSYEFVPAAGTVSPTMHMAAAVGNGGTLGYLLAFTCPSAPPQTGQWVYNEVATPAADNATTTFFTAWPFADGSLKVRVSGMYQPVASYDGAAGSFTLNFAPTDAGEQPIVDYQGR